MKKEMLFNENDVFLENDEYVMMALTDADKQNYRALFKENSIYAKHRSEEEFDSFWEYMWSRIPDEDAYYISIHKTEDNEYIGNIVIRNPESHTPELGIDIAGKHRRQGNGFKAISLAKKRLYETGDIGYILIRIYSDNYASQGLFQKLGASEIGKEDNELAAFMKQYLRENGEEKYNEFFGDRKHDLEELMGRNYIGRYKL